MREVNEFGRRKIELWEGLPGGKAALHAYRDSVGVWTIGYGHTGPEVKAGLVWTQMQCEQALDRDLDEAERTVASLVKVPLNDNQFAALVSFVFNVGVSAFRGSSLLRMLNQNRYDLVPKKLLEWVNARDRQTGKLIKLKGLVNRRINESALWNLPAQLEMPVAHFAALPVTNEVPETPPRKDKVLATSTGKAQALALTTGAAAAVADTFGDTLLQIMGHLQALHPYMEGAKYALAINTMILIGWTLWDRHRKIRDEGE